MKIIVEQNIPFFDGLFTQYATVERLPSDAIDRAAVADADALVVRTRTRCDRSLLQGSAVRFIGTATIGTDHIDADYWNHCGQRAGLQRAGCGAVGDGVGGWLAPIPWIAGPRARAGDGHCGRGARRVNR